MGRANLEDLINEVLGMVKGQQDEVKKLRRSKEVADVNKSWDETEAGQAYWKDRRTQQNQGLINQGGLDIAKENNAGQLARQSLSNIGNETVENIKAGASRYGSELGLKGHEVTAKATVDAAQNKGEEKGAEKGFADLIGKVIDADPGILTDTKRLNETVSNIRTFFPPQRGAGSEFDRAPQPASTAPQTDIRTPQKPAITMPTLPVRQEKQEVPASSPIVRTPSYADRPSAMGLSLSPFRNSREIAEAVPKEKAYFAEQSKMANISNSEEEKRKRREKLQGWI